MTIAPRTRAELSLMGIFVMVGQATSVLRSCADGQAPPPQELRRLAAELEGCGIALSDVLEAER